MTLGMQAKSLRRTVRAAGCVALALGAGLAAPEAAEAGSVTINVAVTVFQHEVSPLSMDHNDASSYTIALTGKNSAHYSCSDGCNLDLTLGQPHRIGDGQVTYNVRNGVFLINLAMPSYTATTRITTDGVSTCSASVSTRLRPGHRYFEFYRKSNHEKMLISDWRITINSCSIAST